MKKIVFMSSPPISETKLTSGWSFSTAAATATTSWMNLPPTSGAIKPLPDPVKKMTIAARLEAALRLHAVQELENLFRLPACCGAGSPATESGRSRR